MEKNLILVYKAAEEYAKSHYENFPVISFFLTKELRKHVALVYQFARQADDIADEGEISKDRRICELDKYENELIMCEKGEYINDFWRAVKNTMDSYNLSPKHFHNLLIAFKMDLTKKRYINFDELLGYCYYSANPIGRIILEFFGIRDKESFSYSDAICTALQLTNFYQDVGKDFQKNRIYIPQNEMIKFNVDEKIFRLKENNDNFKELLKYQINRTRDLFQKGKNLIERLPMKLKYQISWTISGGEEILKKIEKINHDVLNSRPVLNKFDYLKLMMKSLLL